MPQISTYLANILSKNEEYPLYLTAYPKSGPPA